MLFGRESFEKWFIFLRKFLDVCAHTICRSLFKGRWHHTSTLLLPCPKMYFCFLQSCLPRPPLLRNKTCTPKSPGPWGANGTSVRGAKFSSTPPMVLLRSWATLRWRRFWNLTWNWRVPQLRCAKNYMIHYMRDLMTWCSFHRCYCF